MNTSTLGLIKLPHLAAFCIQIGLTPITGDDYRSAATSIRAGLDANGPFPILVSDEQWPGLKAWTEKAARETRVVVLRVTNGVGIPLEGTVDVALPATLGDIMAAAGVQIDPRAAGFVIDEYGNVTEPGAVSPVPPAAQPVEQAPPAPAAPTFEQPAPVFDQVPATSVEDPWEAQQPGAFAPPAPEFEMPAPPAVTPETTLAFEQPAAVADPWEAQQPEPTAPPAPAFEMPTAPAFEPPAVPVFEQPEPTAPPAPAFEMPTAPAFEPPAVPVFEQPEPTAPPAPTFEMPAVPAPDTEVPLEQPATPSPIGASPRQRQEGLADTIIVWAGKGGVGKSTCSFSLAQRASKAGLRVILVDANFGQGDMRTFLRIGNAGLPSIYQAAVSGDLKQALIDPDTLNQSRSLKLDPLGFAVVQAPPAHLTDPTVVTPEAYMQVIEQARDICDLVIVDTQIIESVDTSGMVDRLVMPLLRAGAWGVGVTDLSSPGISNLLTRLKAFSSQGVSREQQMTTMNRIPQTVPFNIEGVASTFNEHSVFLGAIYADDAIPENMNRGRAVSDMPVIAPILDAVLGRITGRSEFEPGTQPLDDTGPGRGASGSATRTGGLFSRFRKGKN